MQHGDTRVIRAWTLYDWANSVYMLTITSAIFPVYYEGITRTGTSDLVTFLGLTFKNTALYTYAMAFAYLVVAALCPLLSGIADYSGRKKRFMALFCYLGSFACAGLFFFTKGRLELGIALVVLACIGYSGGLVFYNAFLPEIAAPEDQDRVSARGYAMGYLGGAAQLVLALIVVLNADAFGISEGFAARLSFLSAGLWWFLFAQIPLRVLPENVYDRHPHGNLLIKGYRELGQVWRQLQHTPRLTRFLLAFFVYSMGVQTVMLVATLFGTKEIGMATSDLITVILTIQFVAIPGAYGCAALARRIGNVATLKLITLVWVGICIGAFFVQTAGQFFLIAIAVGTVMGAIQSLSRSTYSKMLPETMDHASFFSFYDVCEKLSIVCGMALFGFIETMTDSMRSPILALLTFFLAGFLLLSRIRPTKPGGHAAETLAAAGVRH